MSYTNVVVDLSEFNGSVDFQQAKEDGILGVFHRATIGCPELRQRGDQTYKDQDAKYVERAAIVKEKGLFWGAYHYGLGGLGSDQAKHFLDITGALKNDKILLALSIEEPKNRGNQMSLNDAKEFVEEIHRQRGTWPVIYGGRILRELAAQGEKSVLKVLSNCPLWVSRWGEESTIVLPKGWDSWHFWQYTNGRSGNEPHEVKGIGPCDRDKFKGTLEELTTFWNNTESASLNARVTYKLTSHCNVESDFSFNIDTTHRAKSFNQRVRFLVMHYTAGNFESSLRELTQGGVSAHYLVPDAPIGGIKKVFLLVKEDLRAWHAGVSSWQGRTNLNDTSIGIEIVNLGYKDLSGQKRWFPFTDYQIEIVTELAKDIIHRYNIEPTAVVGHSDIAPGRKLDPGALFPWKRLAQEGVGAWYDETRVKELKDAIKGQEINISSLQQDLKKYGYQIEKTGVLDEKTRRVVGAFQMHFRPRDYSGTADMETRAILKNLIEKYKS